MRSLKFKCWVLGVELTRSCWLRVLSFVVEASPVVEVGSEVEVEAQVDAQAAVESEAEVELANDCC